MSIQYRPFKRTDLVLILSINDERWAPFIPTIASGISVEDDSCKCYIAMNGTDFAGFVFGYALPNRTLFPQFLYVEPQYRKQGIGSKLLLTLEKASGCNTSIIYYDSRLHSCYSKIGYDSGRGLETAIKDLV